MRVIIPLADGFEEIEAICVIDVLRRANLDVTTVNLDGNPVTGSHGVQMNADKNIFDLDYSSFDVIVLPGGQPGTNNLLASSEIKNALDVINKNDGYLAAICAAPIVLGSNGYLKGKNATCFPGHEGELVGAEIINDPVVVDGKIITGKGAGASLDFALKLVEVFCSKDVSEDLRSRMQIFW